MKLMMRSQEKIMREAGYVTATDAAQAIGADNVGTIHRMVKAGKLRGARAGRHWYVSVASLLKAHKDAPPIIERIRALGVEPKEEPSASAENEAHAPQAPQPRYRPGSRARKAAGT